MAGLFRKMRMVLARFSMACPELVEGKPKIVTKPKNLIRNHIFLGNE